MIENPQVGQRVWRLSVDWQPSVLIDCVWGDHTASVQGRLEQIDPNDLYDSPQSAAAALRNQAQELLLAAAKLEQENANAD